jgi:hypothetical protein
MRDFQRLPPIEPPGGGFFWAIKTAVLTSGMLALTMTSGCFAMAAPMVLDVARAAVSGISPSGHTTKNNDQIEQNTELCDMGGRDLPRLIELRTDNLGTTTYRTLNPGGPVTQSQLQQGGGNRGGSDEWRAMGDLAGMHFQPPIQKSQLAPGSVIFLAYAQSQVHDPVEQRQFDALSHDFGPVLGTLDWDNRVFLYSALHRLPCESPPAAAPLQASRKPVPSGPEQPEQPEQPR